MKIEKTSTGVIIREASDDVKRKCLQYFSLNKPLREFFIYSGNDPDNRSIFGKDRDVIYITSGFLKINDKTIQSLKCSEIHPSVGKSVDITMNRQPRSRLQTDCIQKLTTSSSNKITVELKPGTGKEEPYSRKIPTPNGYTLMGDLQLGDYVFDKYGNPTKVVGIFEQGEKDVYEVTFQDGRTALCGLDHLWTVKNHMNGKWETVTLRYLIERMSYGNFDYRIPTCMSVQFKEKPTPINPWVIGCFVAGNTLKYENLTIKTFNDEIPYAIASKCGFHVKSEGLDMYTFWDDNDEPIKTKDFFDGIEISDGCIPEVYLVNSVTVRLNVLQGIMDMSGCVVRGKRHSNIRVSSSSRKLLEQIRYILYSFGYSCKITDKTLNGSYVGSLKLLVPNRVKELIFNTSLKKTAVHSTNDFISYTTNNLSIKDIKFSHVEKCRCIMVDNHEHLYLTEDFIVTHNTFIALYSISKLKDNKPLIIAPTTLLKNQWIENIVDLGIDKSDIATTITEAPDKKICVVTISAMENALRDDWEGLMKTIAKSEFGIKIIDEAHLHLKGVLKLDAVCNIKRNWYLSATLGRSNAEEDRILNRSLLDADRFVGNATYEEYQDEYVEVFFQDIYYYPSTRLCNQHFRYGSKGLVRATYYNMLMNYRNGTPFLNNIMTMIKRTKHIVSYGKVLVLVPIITTIHAAVERMEKDPYFKQFKIAGVDGGMSISEKRAALESDIIISTSMSMGTGVDISDLAAVVNFDQYASPIITEQIFGRLRNRKDKKRTYYIDICDHVRQARTIENWGRKRRVLIPYFPGADANIKLLPKIRC